MDVQEAAFELEQKSVRSTEHTVLMTVRLALARSSAQAHMTECRHLKSAHAIVT